MFVTLPAFSQFCAPGSPPPKKPVPRTSNCSGPDGGGVARSETSCQSCKGSPCYPATGNYISSATDLQIGTPGFPLTVFRSYESAYASDGPLGVGWTINLTAHIYYAVYLYAAPST